MTARQLLKKMFPPMLATLASGPPADEKEWTWELKYDGFRAVTAIAGGDAAMLSRNELDLSSRFPTVFEAVKKLGVGELVVDGEIVVFDKKGAPRFQLLQQGGGKEQLVLFDVLWMDGHDLRGCPYVERRRLLEALCAKAPAGIVASQTLAMSGAQALLYAKANGWEGIMAKRNSSVYEGRRSKQWLKIKALHEQEFVIIGWQPSSANDRDVGSLHLAVFEGDELHYAGKVGTGFSAKMRTSLLSELAKDVVPASPAGDAPRVRDAHWVRPRLVAQVAFTEWTSDNRLRHPSFLGLREDKEVKDVVKETPQPAAARTRSGADRSGGNGRDSKSEGRVQLTHPDRILYPRDGITKQDVADYYQAIAGPMLRALEDRPLTLEHWNEGIDKPSWFHQNIGKEGAKWLRLVSTPTRGHGRPVKHLVVDGLDALRWLAQMSVLTIHMWSSREGSLEEPDWLIFDLDPAKGKGILQAVEAALVMRRVLENLDLPSVPKTSGKRGIHIFIPLASGHTHDQVADFAGSVAAAIAAKVPDITVERSLSQRRGRLYLDSMQNGYGKTMVAPYSPRAIDGAPVSAPLKWSEITRRLDPLKYNLRTMPNRLAKVGDLFTSAMENGVKLPELK